MLDTFYGDVLPSSGMLVLGSMIEGQAPKHYSVPIREVRRRIEELDKATNVFLTLGSYNIDEGYLPEVEHLKGQAQGVKAFAFDLDVGEETTKYDTLQDAAVALEKAVNDDIIPEPRWIIATGGGLHFYFVMGTEVNNEVWTAVFNGLRETCTANGLLIDRAVGTHPYRLLRAPGTTNKKLKYGAPREVKVLREGSYQTLEELQGYCSEIPEYSEQDIDPGDFEPLASETLWEVCPMFRTAAQTGGKEHSEPEWFGMASWCHGVKNGRKMFHLVSNQHRDYDKHESDQKFDHAAGMAPIRCNNFTGLGFCEGCDVKNSGAPNPFSYVRKHGLDQDEEPKQLLPAPVTNNELDSDGEIEGFERDGNGLYAFGNFVSTYFDVARAQYNEKTKVGVTKITRFDGTTVLFPLKALGYKNNVASELSNMGIKCVNAEAAQMYIQDKALAETPLKEQVALGWDDRMKSFVTPNEVIPNIQPLMASESLNMVVQEWRGRRGRIDNWIRAVDLLKHQGQEPFLMCLLASLGSPLLRYLGLQKGVILSLEGQKGLGKSTAMEIANSVWGAPIPTITTQSDTYMTVRKRMSCCGNLPMSMDETTMVTPEELQKLAFEISQGKGRGRLKQTGELGEVESWQLICLMNSNDSIHRKLLENPAGDGADLTRVFELHIKKDEILYSDHVTVQEGYDMRNMVQDNYGHLGKEFIDALTLENRETLIDEAQQLIRDIKQRHGTSGADRFAESLVVACHVAHKLAKKLYPDFPGDIDVMYEWMQQRMVDNSSNIEEATAVRLPTVENFLLAFEQDHNIVRPDAGTDRSFTTMGVAMKGMLYQIDHLVYVPQDIFNKWCTMSSIRPEMVISSWAEKGHLVPTGGGIKRPRYVGKCPDELVINGEAMRPTVLIINRESYAKIAQEIQKSA